MTWGKPVLFQPLISHYQGARVDLNRAIELNPNDADRGVVYLVLRRYDEALVDAFAYATRGAVYRMLRRDKEALVDLNRMVCGPRSHGVLSLDASQISSLQMLP